MNWFRSDFNHVRAYSRNWYGTMGPAYPATILIYDDNIDMCMGYMEHSLPDNEMLTPMTEEDVLDYISKADPDDPNVWFGERLEHRWDDPEGGE